MKFDRVKGTLPGSVHYQLGYLSELRSLLHRAWNKIERSGTHLLVSIPIRTWSDCYDCVIWMFYLHVLVVQLIDEFGSFDRYIWGFLNHKPIVSRFRYPRHVPIKTSKAETISKDMVRRGLRCVGPTIMYTFMQVAGLTNDHLVSCFCFDKCVNMASTCPDNNKEEKPAEQGKRISVEELTRDVDAISM